MIFSCCFISFFLCRSSEEKPILFTMCEAFSGRLDYCASMEDDVIKTRGVDVVVITRNDLG